MEIMMEEKPTLETNALGAEVAEDASIQTQETEQVTEVVTEEPSKELDVDPKDDVNEDQVEITVDDIAEYFGIESDKLSATDDGIQLKTKIDGKESSVPLNDAIVAYQKQGHLDNQHREVAALKKTLKEQQTQAQTQIQEKLQLAEDLTSLAYQDLQSDYNSINWEELEADDPGEFAAKQMKFQNRINALAGRLEQLKSNREVPDVTEARKEMSEKLISDIESWSDPAVAEKEYQDIANYGLAQGFSTQEINNTVDSRIIHVLRKAMFFDQMEEKKPAIKNVVRKATKLAKPGAKTKPKTPKRIEDVFYGT